MDNYCLSQKILTTPGTIFIRFIFGNEGVLRDDYYHKR